MVPVPTFEKVMVPVLVPTCEKLRFRFRFQLHIYTIKSKFFFKSFFSFLHSKLFYKEKDYKYQQIIVKCVRKFFKMKVIKYLFFYLVPVPEP
jgi:hypothetical protein